MKTISTRHVNIAKGIVGYEAKTFYGLNSQYWLLQYMKFDNKIIRKKLCIGSYVLDRGNAIRGYNGCQGFGTVNLNKKTRNFV
jgi:hypothetical protein